MNTLHIRRAVLADVPGIVNVVTTTFPQDFERNGHFDTMMCSEFFIRAIEDPHEFVVVGTLDEKIAGFVYYVNKPPTNGTIALEMIGVYRDFQGRGWGRKLLTEGDALAVQYFNEQCGIPNIATIHLTTSEDNPAGQNLYMKAGYRHVGNIPGLVGEGNVELVMLKKVGKVEYRKNLWNKPRTSDVDR